MKKILAVDNQEIILKFIKKKLSAQGYQVLTADSGLSALDILKTYTPDIVIVDLVMPNIDGRQLCQLIRAMPGLEETYIIILSAIVAEDPVDLAKLGANLCIAKGPFDQMGLNIVEAVKQAETLSAREVHHEVLGLQNVFPRIATSELLSVKRHFEIILEEMVEGILEMTPDGRIIYANPAVTKLLGKNKNDLLGTFFEHLFTGSDQQRIIELMGMPLAGVKRIQADDPLQVDGHTITLEIISVASAPPTLLVIFNDITELRKAEMEKMQAEKIKGALEMTVAMSLKVNQPLQAIMGHSELLRMGLDEDHPCYKNVLTILDQVTKIGKIIGRIGRVTEYRAKEFVLGKTMVDLGNVEGEDN
jgi:PAS domain S-box-containing protein